MIRFQTVIASFNVTTGASFNLQNNNILKSGNLLAITYARLDYWFLIFFIICLCNYIFLK